MSKPLQNPLHPKAAKQLESYLEELIINPTFEYEPQNDEDLGMWMWTHFVFHEPPLEKIERLIPNPDHVNGDDIESICYRVLVHLFKEKDIIRNKIPDWGEPSQMLGIYDTKDYIDNEFITIAKQILLDYLYRVPFEYTVFTPFPQDILPDFNPFVISDRMKLIKVEYDSDGKNFPPLFAEHYEFKGELLSESKKVVDYLAIKIFGSGINSHRTVFRKALGTLKIFAAALHAMGVLEYQEYGSSNTDSSDSRRNCFIYPIDEHRKPPFLQEENTSVQINENEDDWNFLNRLRLNKSCLEPNQLELIAIERGKKKNSLEEKHKRFQQKLRSVRKLFLSTSDVEKMMDWTEAYLVGRAGGVPLIDATGVYVCVFAPGHVGKPDSQVLYSGFGNPAYYLNKGLDGYFTRNTADGRTQVLRDPARCDGQITIQDLRLALEAKKARLISQFQNSEQ